MKKDIKNPVHYLDGRFLPEMGDHHSQVWSTTIQGFTGLIRLHLGREIHRLGRCDRGCRHRSSQGKGAVEGPRLLCHITHYSSLQEKVKAKMFYSILLIMKNRSRFLSVIQAILVNYFRCFDFFTNMGRVSFIHSYIKSTIFTTASPSFKEELRWTFLQLSDQDRFVYK